MDKEKRIAELDFVIRKAEIEKAYHNGARLVFSEIGENVYKDYDGSHGNFAWGFYDYKIKEEPKRIPFDGSNAFSLMNKIFRTKNDHSNLRVGVGTDDYNVMFHDMNVDFVELEKYWEKYNTLTETFEPCNKVA